MNKELLLKYIEGDCTDLDKVDIAKWLDSDPDHMKEYLALHKLHDITIWQTTSVNKSEKKIEKKTSVWQLKHIYVEFLKVTAVFIVAILTVRYILPYPTMQSPAVVLQTIHVPAGQRAEITMADGTKVWLNAKSTLIFPNQFLGRTREVKLDGEGFFEVAHNKSMPFIVNTKKYNVRVWGTRFNLMAYSENEIFETSLLEGSVEVLKSGSTKGTMLRPDERVYLENDCMVTAPIVDTNHFLWKEGIISFDDETFPEMVCKLELYFDLKIEVKNEEILNYRCTGKFRTKDGVEHILKVLKLSNKFSYTIDYKKNIITIK